MTPKEYVSGVKNLPTVSSVAAKVNELLNSPTSNAQDFDDVISQDPALTAKLLKLVNSAFYGLSYKVESISRAVSVVGFKQIRELVTSIAVIDAFKDFDDEVLNMKKFWEHSLGCGVAARVLAIYKRVPNPELFFTAGLLHDVGKLIILSHSPADYGKVLEINNRNGHLGYDAEKEIFGFDHGEVGAELCRRWNHPDALQEAVSFHHDPERSVEFSDLTATVHVADIIVSAFRIGSTGDVFVPPLSPEAWEKTGLKISVLEPATDKIYQQLYEIVTALLP